MLLGINLLFQSWILKLQYIDINITDLGAVDVEHASQVSDLKTGALLQGKPGR